MAYVDVNGLATWHEVHGSGQPVVLLHGAFGGASSWSFQVPALVGAGYKVYVPERRGHAHTRDVEGPLTYGVMADDTVAYLDGVVGGPQHFPVVYAKTMRMVTTEPELDLGSLALFTAPTLVLQGDRGEVTLEHGAAV